VFYESFAYQAQTWAHPRRVVAKVEWHADELFPRGTAEQWIKEGKYAIRWTQLSCQTFKDNQARLQLFALVYNLANFLRRLALPREVQHWTLTTLREKLIKIGAKVVQHARYVIFQLAEVAVPRVLFARILERIQWFAVPPPLADTG
jgi:hypothetical protein